MVRVKALLQYCWLLYDCCYNKSNKTRQLSGELKKLVAYVAGDRRKRERGFWARQKREGRAWREEHNGFPVGVSLPPSSSAPCVSLEPNSPSNPCREGQKAWYSPGETHETLAKLEANAHQIQKQGTVYHYKQQNSVTISTIRTVLA